MAQRICSTAGCGKPHRAKGLCSTHYNDQHQPNRHAAKPTVCVVCGMGVLRPPSKRKPACSTTCRRIVQFGPAVIKGGGYKWALDAAQRARAVGAIVVEVFDRAAVFEKDAWTCYLCSKQIDPDASPFDPNSATVDHVIALSKGGEHSIANTRTACLRCNSMKQDHAA